MARLSQGAGLLVRLSAGSVVVPPRGGDQQTVALGPNPVCLLFLYHPWADYWVLMWQGEKMQTGMSVSNKYICCHFNSMEQMIY